MGVGSMITDPSPHAALVDLFFGFFAGLGWAIAAFVVSKIVSAVNRGP